MNQHLFRSILLVFFIYTTQAHCQNDSIRNKYQNREGLYYGVNVGFTIASDNDATFYNGAATSTNSIERVLDTDYGTSYTGSYREQLEVILNDEIVSIETPQTMSFKPALMVGLTAGYNISNYWGIYIDINYTQLSTSGVFVMNLLSPPPPSSLEQYNQAFGAISAQESRVLLNLGIHRAIDMHTLITPYLEAAINMTYSKVESHEMSYQNFTASLINYNQLNPNYSAQTEMSEFGFGGIWTLGAQMPLSNRYFIMFGYEMAYTDNGIAMNKHDLNHNFILRFFF